MAAEDPINALREALDAEWLRLTYDVPLVYGYREARRTKDLDAVAAGGRIVWHAGAWPGPDAAAGELDADPLQAYEAGRNVATHWAMFTVHCHGYDPAFPDEGVAGGEAAHDGMTWRLMQAYLGAISKVIPANGWYRRVGAPVWVRDPAERRFGELIRFEMQVSFGVREWPAYPLQTLTPVPTGKVVTPNGTVTIIEGAA